MPTSKKGRKVHVAPNSIEIDGKRFINIGAKKTKIAANKYAKDLKEDHNTLVRVKKTNSLYGRYSIYTAKK